MGWIATPVMSGFLAFFSLFFIKNIFSIDVGHKVTEKVLQNNIVSVTAEAGISEIIKYLLLGILIVGSLVIIFLYLLERKKKRELRLSEQKFWRNLK
jgi:hypothetical protein